MDLSRFDTREKASAGAQFDLVIDGETVYGDDDKPVTFTIKGIADSEVHALVLKQLRAPGSTPTETYSNDMKLARVAVTGWSDNFSVNGEKVPFSKSNIETVLANPVVRREVLRKLTDESLFMNGS